MKNLKKYNLAFLPTISYVKKTLDESNLLSKWLLKMIDFENGHFLTYLPKNINNNALYNFEIGGISSNNYLETAHLIFKEMQGNKKISCVIDDVIRGRLDVNIKSFGALNLFQNDEVYYLLNNASTKVENILRCLHETDAIWHSLCILTAADFNDVVDQNLTPEKIQEICLNTKMIIVGAYDGEGYVFWEKNER